MNPKDYVLSVRIRGDKEGPQTGDVVLNGSAINDWLPQTEYKAGDVVVYGAQFYQSIEDQTSGNNFDRSLWNQIGIPDIVVPEFETQTVYVQGQLVAYEGKLYRAKHDFTSSVRFYEDDWDNVSGETYTFTSEDRSIAITLNDTTVDFSVGSALNTLRNELQMQLDHKVDSEDGKGLSANDYTAVDKAKLTSLMEIFRLGDNLTLDPDGTLNAGFSISFDPALSRTSTNAVQNKVVTAKLEQLEADIDSNSSDISDAKADIADIQSSVADIQSDIADMGTSVSDVQAELANKVDVVAGKELSSNDFTDAMQTKLNRLLGIFSIGDNLTLVNNKLSAIDTHVELANTTGNSTTKGMTQAAITNAITAAESGIVGDLATVATTGEYNDLLNTPTIDNALSTTSSNAVENRVVTTALNTKANSSSLAAVATTGKYSDLLNKPVVDASVNSTSTNAVQNKAIAKYVDDSIDALATVAKSGSYNDLTDKPSINVGSGLLTVNDEDNNEILKFSANAQLDSTVALPTASTSNLGLVKVDGTVSTSSQNPVENKVITEFVNSSINSNSAHYLTKNIAGDAFATKAELTAATKFYYAGSEFTPTKNDYVVVITDESQDEAQTRYVAQQSGSSIVWAFQYKVNDKPFTAAQNNAINSGITSDKVTKLDNIASGAEVNVQADWNTTDTAADSYIKNKPTIPTVNNATLTIQKNGTSVGTFTANASNNTTANITVPTKTSDITNDSGYITKSVDNLDNYTKSTALATVATSGSYTDLSNKPTIPTVNNATLTIQKNGTSVGTFTANASSNTTANITVPTKTSEITNDSGYITKSVSNLDNYTKTSALAAVATSGSYNDLTDIPTEINAYTKEESDNKYVAKRTSGTTAQLYGVNSSNATTMYNVGNTATANQIAQKGTNGVLVVGTPTSDSHATTKKYVDDAIASATPTGLATVATTGSYTDLINKPTIPTVNNATLTIQKNGTSVGTFTANSSTATTANITVPTKTSELTNDSSYATTSYVNSLVTITTTDPGEGSTLTQGHFIAVVE